MLTSPGFAAGHEEEDERLGDFPYERRHSVRVWLAQDHVALVQLVAVNAMSRGGGCGDRVRYFLQDFMQRS
jgi:hypothetical protein